MAVKKVRCDAEPAVCLWLQQRHVASVLGVVTARREKVACVSVNYSHARGEVGGLMYQVKPKVADLR
jgi:hypothetical protein